MSTTSAADWGPTRWATHGPVHLAFDRLADGVGGEPLLLATGLGANRRWVPDGLCRRFAAQGFDVARYDQRDGGESTHLPPRPAANPIMSMLRGGSAAYSAEDMVDDAVAVLDALGWESAHLLGVSLGGAVVQRVALRHPGRVRSLTTVAAVPGDVAGLATLRFVRWRTLARFARLSFPEAREGAVAAGVAVSRLLASPHRDFDQEAAREAAERNADAGLHDGAAQSRQIGARWRGGAIDRIARPTLVLHGRDDPLIRPRAARAIADRINGSRLVLLPDTGHELPEHTWEQVAAEVRRVADASPAGPSTE